MFALPLAKGKHPCWPESALASHVRPAAVEAKITKRVGWNGFKHSLASMQGDLQTQPKLRRAGTWQTSALVEGENGVIAKR